MSINERVEKILQEQLSDQLGFRKPPTTNVLVLAVSGGPDSLSLLHLLCAEGLYPRNLLVVAHLNHGLRDSADDEADFVMAFAAEHNVRGVAEKREVAALARSEGLSVEEAGRQARYQFLADVAREVGARAIATGHNADDQVETIVMHLLRGSARTGLRGMQIASPVPGSPDLTLIRPFLQVSRREIETYCANNNLEPVIDKSNRDVTYYRNRLRHELIPILEEYNPQIRERLREMATIINDEESLLDDLTGREWERLLIDQGPGWVALERAEWPSIPIGLKRRLVRQAMQTLVPDTRNVGFRTTEQAKEVAASAQIGSTSSLPAGVILRVDYDKLVFSTKDAAIPSPNLPQLVDVGEYDLPVPGRLELENGWIIQAQILEHVDSRIVLDNPDAWQAFVAVRDPDRIMVRARLTGERFQPLGMSGGSAKVSRVMIDRKIPKMIRAKWPIVADHRHLLWLVGHHIDDRARIDSDRPYYLHLHAYRQVDEQ